MPSKNWEKLTNEYDSADFTTKNYGELAKIIRENACQFLEENDYHWEFCKRSRNVLIQRTHDPEAENGKNHIFRAEGILEKSLEDLAQIVHPASPYRTSWDNFVTMKILKKIGKNMVIEHLILKHHLLGLISARDMIHLVEFSAPKDNIRQNFAASIPYPQYPVDHGVVRALTYPSAFRMEAINSESTKVTLTVRTDMKFPWFLPVPIIEKGFPTEIFRFFEQVDHASKTVTLTERHHLPGWS